MKKMILFFAAFCIVQSLFCAELTAKFVTVEAGKKDTVEESIEYLKSGAVLLIPEYVNVPRKLIIINEQKRALFLFIVL